MRTVCVIGTVSLLLLFSLVSAQEIHEVYIGEIDGYYSIGGIDYLKVDQEIVIPIHIRSTGVPECRFALSMAFEVESPDGAQWEYTTIESYSEYRSHWALPYTYWWNFDNLFGESFIGEFSTDGMGADTVGFAGIVMNNTEGICSVYEGLDYFEEKCLLLKIKPTQESVGKTICIDKGGDAITGYEWKWYGLGLECNTPVVIPDWSGPLCFEVYDYQAHCCILSNMGFTGNVDCSLDGKRNLADIVQLIAHVYITQEDLCCHKNGNVNGDDAGKVNLADITRLIDHVYISHEETAICR